MNLSSIFTDTLPGFVTMPGMSALPIFSTAGH